MMSPDPSHRAHPTTDAHIFRNDGGNSAPRAPGPGLLTRQH